MSASTTSTRKRAANTNNHWISVMIPPFPLPAGGTSEGAPHGISEADGPGVEEVGSRPHRVQPRGRNGCVGGDDHDRLTGLAVALMPDGRGDDVDAGVAARRADAPEHPGLV